MVISDSHQFIFFSVPKTGSSSTEAALEAYTSDRTSEFNRHATCLKVQRDVPEQMWQSYFKFAFVRDPYDRMLSWYFYRKRDELKDSGHERHHLYTGEVGFDQWIAEFAKNELMFKQVDFIAPHGGGLLVDEVGRFETLQQDFDKICSKLELPPIELPRVRTSRKPGIDLESLWSVDTRSIVNDYFREDFEFFGYPLKTA